jgi:adenylosuccinate lyase
MHERYMSEAMRQVWSAGYRYERWREVELAVLAARAALGELPADVVEAAAAAAVPTAVQVDEAEAVTRHDVMAFLTAWTAHMPPGVAGWVHRDLTSSDIVDTALALTVRHATDLLLAATDRLVAALREHALAHVDTVRLGRTHGMAAAPDVWGHRVADFAFAAARCRDRLRQAREMVAVAKLSGPVGTYAGLDPRIETATAERLSLRPAPVATQVVSRDGLAEWMFALSVTATVCEAVALEVRHGQRFEVSELAEPTTAGQTGSSAMPHKRNPILSEKVCGLARVVRSLVLPVTEGIALWHERDISHSSVERVCLPDASALTEHVVATTVHIVTGLQVDKRRMRANLAAAGATVFSDGLLSILVDAGIPRSTAYELLRHAAEANATPDDFEAVVRAGAAAVGVGLPHRELVQLAVERLLRSEGLAAMFDRLRPESADSGGMIGAHCR